ncbi:hypothetical protein ElyMa_003217500 [Elysia marginata]|uniref:Uncharacterized protein n=1 Tax=Elysia marginata TaxID=1093978 RepID=A0AAV4J3N4_9GAST|nr:hypothetical protein ElyMa_003217500 [Elysia marginata]
MNYTIQFRYYKANANAGGLSRLPIPTTTSSTEVYASGKLFYTTIMDSTPLSPIIIARASKQDTILTQVIKLTISPKTSAKLFSHFLPGEMNPLFNKTVCYGDTGLSPHKNLHKQILHMLHDGHLEIKK